MNYRVIAISPENNFVSRITISCKYGIFEGEARFNATEDEKYYSKYFGYQIAEKRALIKAYKYRIKLLRHEIALLQNISNSFDDMTFTNFESQEWTYIRVQISIKKEEIKTLDEKIDKMEEAIEKSVEDRIKQIDKINEKLKKK